MLSVLDSFDIENQYEANFTFQMLFNIYQLIYSVCVCTVQVSSLNRIISNNIYTIKTVLTFSDWPFLYINLSLLSRNYCKFFFFDYHWWGSELNMGVVSVGIVWGKAPENSWGWGCVDFQRRSSVCRPLFSWGSLCLSHTAGLWTSSDLAPPWIELYSEPVTYHKTQSQNSVMHQGMFFEGTTAWRLQFVVVQISLPTYSDIPLSVLPTSTHRRRERDCWSAHTPNFLL